MSSSRDQSPQIGTDAPVLAVNGPHTLSDVEFNLLHEDRRGRCYQFVGFVERRGRENVDPDQRQFYISDLCLIHTDNEEDLRRVVKSLQSSRFPEDQWVHFQICYFSIPGSLPEFRVSFTGRGGHSHSLSEWFVQFQRGLSVANPVNMKGSREKPSDALLRPRKKVKQSLSLPGTSTASSRVSFYNPLKGKPIEYWRQEFEDAMAVNNDPLNATLKLLLEYSGASYDREFDLGLEGGGSLSRFTALRWNTHHGDAVYKALSSVYAAKKKNGPVVDVNTLMSALKGQLADKTFNPNGDLQKILDVIEEKTGVTLDGARAQAVQALHR